MRKASLFLLFVLFSAGARTQPLPAKVKHTVIIDTDCAIDDMRAISLLLSRPEITVKAILLSDGSLTPADGDEKVRSLLHAFGRDSIPVADGDVLKGVDPPWREFNKLISWGNQTGIRGDKVNALDCLSERLRNTDEKIILVCLGPLTNIAQLIKKNEGLLSKIERVIWYNESVKPLQGFNYECDKASADLVFKSNVRIDVISNLHKEEALFDSSMFNVCQQSRTSLAAIFYNVYRQPAVLEKLKQNHFKFCDDLTALYITNPELFDINTMQNKVKVRYNQDFNVQGVREAIFDMLNGTYVSERNVVFNRFPDQREMFNYDIRPIMDSAIARIWKGRMEGQCDDRRVSWTPGCILNCWS